MAGRFTKGKLSRIHELWLNRWFLRWLLRTSEGEGLSHKVVTRQSLRILPSPIYFSTFAIFRDQRCLMRKIWTRRQLDERWKFNLNICWPVFSANGDNIYNLYWIFVDQIIKFFSANNFRKSWHLRRAGSRDALWTDSAGVQRHFLFLWPVSLHLTWSIFDQ